MDDDIITTSRTVRIPLKFVAAGPAPIQPAHILPCQRIKGQFFEHFDGLTTYHSACFRQRLSSQAIGFSIV